ncbi:MAG: helix-turn-helix domain-containing protein, partial [Syntrophomonadaceae bacterium]|nr:helix-turn-helix domain-containing protein [Syntrophomonadaceae bacterium]
AMDILVAYDWPGNVRELENIIERAVVMGGGEILLPDHLPENIRSFLPSEEDLLMGLAVKDRPLKEILHEVEKKVIQRALALNHWNKAQTAAKLQISRSALLYKIEEYGLEEK